MLFHRLVCFSKKEIIFRQILLFFSIKKGPTPIVPVLRRVLHDKKHEIEERKLLILLATDGVPTDNQGHRDIRSFEYVLRNERKPTNRIPITIIACTGEDNRPRNFS